MTFPPSSLNQHKSFYSQDVAADHALLQREGVTHVLNVATGIEIDHGDSGVVEERVELLDIPEQCILQSETDVKICIVLAIG